MRSGFFSICGMPAVYIPVSYQSVSQQTPKHLSPCLQLALAADFSQDVTQEVNWLECSYTIQPPHFQQTKFYDRRCSCCKAGNFSLLIVFSLVILVVCDFQINSVNKRNKACSGHLGKMFQNTAKFKMFHLNFSRTYNNLTLVRSTVIRGWGKIVVRATLFQNKLSFPSLKSTFFSGFAPFPNLINHFMSGFSLFLLYMYVFTEIQHHLFFPLSWIRKYGMQETRCFALVSKYIHISNA